MLVLEASSALSFDAGGNCILINASGIHLQGGNIRINSGGTV